jgi:hypothetical protein
MSITQRSGAGCSITALSWSSDCDSISSRQTSLGEWTKPTPAAAQKSQFTLPLARGQTCLHLKLATLPSPAVPQCVIVPYVGPIAGYSLQAAEREIVGLQSRHNGKVPHR